MSRGLTFSIEGKFMTDFAREKLYVEHDLGKAIEILETCTVTDSLSKAEQMALIIDVLEGRKDLKGTYPGPEYGPYDAEPGTRTPGIAALIRKLDEENKALKSRISVSNRQISFLLEEMDLPDYRIDELNRQWRESEYDPDDDSPCAMPEWLFPDHPSARIKETGTSLFGSALLDDFMRAAHANTGDDYGWLSPSGDFTPVSYGDHWSWAHDYVKAHPAEFELPSDPLQEAGDLLCARGWILLHSPHNGVARPTRNESRRVTKAQREFLYGYYADRGMSDLAAEWIED